jgi:4-hydroxyproline epimerase
VAGVIFVNNVGVIGMCGHGTIGLAVTLGHLGRITAGSYKLDTPVGVVGFEYDGRNAVTVENVPSFRHAANVTVNVGGRPVTGDVAWGGNWFFLTDPGGHAVEAGNVAALTAYSWAVRRALVRDGITGANGGEIDHIELVGPPADPANHGRNFILCPGGAFDRSPCGTGTSAKLACLAADGKLNPGDVWRQESVIGSVFEGRYRPLTGGRIVPSITGTAFVTAEATLLFDDADPLRAGIRG